MSADEFITSPAKRRHSKEESRDKSTTEYQRLAWQTLEKTINNRVRRVMKSNIQRIARELFEHNIIRGRGLLASAIIKEQLRSPYYTPVYAALVSIINTKLPLIGELICKRVISLWRESYTSNDEKKCFATIIFLAHLINQNLIAEKFAFELLDLVLGNYTDDSVKLAVIFLRHSGQKLSQVSPQELDSVFSRLENLRHESSLNKCTQDMIEHLSVIRTDHFCAYPAVEYGLHLVKDDQRTFIFNIFSLCEPEHHLNEFKYDDEYEQNEERYKELRKKNHS